MKPEQQEAGKSTGLAARTSEAVPLTQTPGKGSPWKTTVAGNWKTDTQHEREEQEAWSEGKTYRVTWAQASIWCWIIGTPATGNSGLGTSKDKGLKRVPERGQENILASYFLLSQAHPPFQSTHSPIPHLLTLLGASNEDHSFKHDDRCYLNLKPQQKNYNQISYPQITTRSPFLGGKLKSSI